MATKTQISELSVVVAELQKIIGVLGERFAEIENMLCLSEKWDMNMFIGGLKEYLQYKTNHVKPAASPSIPGTSSKPPQAANIPPYKRFTAEELRERQKKGLCYYCDENEGEVKALEGDEQKVEEVIEVTPKISFNALEGQFHFSSKYLMCHREAHKDSEGFN
ncbi:hypothetical protein G2W53_029197 [Senna tora]|uniref:Uncharacterized protein n=1 Tax=Senna tora TaxID=362788 RepID=A0A834T2I1_9FABA|nr:hypothetical protein G2W53_029197 [Senna tora]